MVRTISLDIKNTAIGCTIVMIAYKSIIDFSIRFASLLNTFKGNLYNTITLRGNNFLIVCRGFKK
jgi:hypothetical protein